MTANPPDAAPAALAAPRHVAIIMDGNGRWAEARGRARGFGHRRGVQAARRAVRGCHRHGIRALTVFAFSQENWQRPEAEVSLLMQLFLRTLSREVDGMHRNGIRLSFIGDPAGFPVELRQLMTESQRRTAGNRSLQLTVAVGYGGKGDIAQAAMACAAAGIVPTAEAIGARLQTADLPEVDLLIRTGGERRISNFMLWQLAYSELYFCDTLWPDFDEAALDAAIDWYRGRERRFGRLREAS